MPVLGAILIAMGAIGTMFSILLGGLFIGRWAGPVSVLFVMVATAGVLLIGSKRR